MTRTRTTSSRLSTIKKREDYALVQKALKGSERAYSELVSRHQGGVYNQMYKMVNNSEDAADLTQEAFGKAFFKLKSYTPNFAFSTWLYKIAINNCIDYKRKKRLQTMSIDDRIDADSDHDFSGNLRADILNPEEVVIREQKIKMMKKVVGGLSNKYRAMIELRYYQELSYDEISQHLELPLGTVKAQLFRAKQILGDRLEQPGPSAFLECTTRKRRKKNRRVAVS